MGPFTRSYSMKYMFVVVDYILKWVAAVALPNNKGKSVIAFLRKIYFLGLVCQDQSSMMGMPTFVIIYLILYLNNMV